MTTGLKQRGNYNTGMNQLTAPRDINPVLQNQMDKYVNQLQHNMKLYQGKQARVALVSLRNQWHKKQVQNSYQNEYDRIRGILNDSVLPGTSKIHIEKRVKDLEKIGVTGVTKFDIA